MAIHAGRRQVEHDEHFQRMVEAQRQGTLLAMQDIAQARKAERDRQQSLEMAPSKIVLFLALGALAAVWVSDLWDKFTNFLFGG